MDTNPRLYQLVADVIRRHSGGEDLVDEVLALVLNEVESFAAARVEEVFDTARIPFDSDRVGHTEEQAGQRWCPFVRETVPLGKGKRDVAIGNRYSTDKDDYTNPAGCRCVASHCMAWRWVTELHGFCGLAGSVGPMPRAEPRNLTSRKPPARLNASPPLSALGGQRHA
jgi:hypothetical protein